MKKIIAFLLIFSLILPVFAFAEESSSDIVQPNDEESYIALQAKFDDLEKQIKESNKSLSSIQGNINDNTNFLAILNSQIDILNSQIRILDDEIKTSEEAQQIINEVLQNTESEKETLTQEISELEKERVKTEKELKVASDELCEIIRNEYINGSIDELALASAFATSDDMSVYLNKEEIFDLMRKEKEAVFENVSKKYKEIETQERKLEKDRYKLERAEETIKTLEEQRVAYRVQLEANKLALETKKSLITEKKNNIKYIISQLDEDSEVYKEQIRKNREEMETISVYVDNYISEYSSKLGDIPEAAVYNTGKMQWPVRFSSYISCGYPCYSDGSPHWGIDIVSSDGNTYGRPFRAAQSGTVIIAMNDNNWNGGFGNYCVIDHGDGTQTLYAHSSGLVVSAGDTVMQGEQLGYIGETGNTTGPHLHFEVRVKDGNGKVQRVNPTNYVSNDT